MKTSRDDGIQAIIDLQRTAGINETREQAARGWDGMAEWERAQTMLAHNIMFGGGQVLQEHTA